MRSIELNETDVTVFVQIRFDWQAKERLELFEKTMGQPSANDVRANRLDLGGAVVESVVEISSRRAEKGDQHHETLGDRVCRRIPSPQPFSIDAQVLTGNLIGIIRDESRAVLPGRTLTLTSPALPGGPSTAVTNAQGEYRFTGLPPGHLSSSRSPSPASRPTSRQDLQVTVNGTVERNVALPVAAVDETITVSGQSPVVDTRRGRRLEESAGGHCRGDPAQPHGEPRGIHGDAAGRDRDNYNRIGGANVMGSADRETSYMSDGILSNGVTGGAAYNYLDFDAIEDLNVVTLGASSEYQQAQGGVMNMVTKAGTNTFRADGMHYWAPARLASAPIKLPCNCPLGETGFKHVQVRGLRLSRRRADLERPLLVFRRREQRRPELPESRPGRTAAEEFQWVRDEYRSNHKFTWKASSKINVSQVLYYEWWHWSNPDFPTFTPTARDSRRGTRATSSPARRR